jgi:hypothetical protein
LIIAGCVAASHRHTPRARVGQCLNRAGAADRRTVPGWSAGPACAWLQPSAG